MKKVISLMLVLVMLLASLTMLFSCKDGEGEGSESVSETLAETKETSVTLEETNEYHENLFISAVPVDELDFDGEEIVIMIRNDAKVKMEWGKDTPVDELDEAILARNETVASNLNLTVTYTYHASSDAGLCYNTFKDLIQGDVKNDLHEYDIAANFGYYAGGVDFRDYTANLLDTDQFPYFDFRLPCWNQSVVKHSNINGQSLCCGGDLTLTMFNFAMVIWHNKDLYTQLRNDDDPADIQDLVLAGEWTAAEFYKWCNIYENSSTDDCDTYGVYIQGESWCTQPTDAIPFAWDLDLMIQNSDGTHSYNVVGNDKAEEAIVLFRKMYGGQGNGFLHTYKGNCKNGGCFYAGNIVFQGDVLCWDENQSLKLRAIDFDYALLPWPMYDESQWDAENETGYYTTAQDCYTLLTVLDHYNSTIPTKGEAVSAYLQYSTEQSYTEVRGMYFEKIVRGKLLGTNDESTGAVTKSRKIFDMIIDDLQFDYWALYSSSLGHIMHLFRYCAAQSEDTLENRYMTQKTTYDDALLATEIWFGLIEDPNA